mmetsp:Transcript_35260/g.93798  ORF Transcript_35260/g.93798 Transcript_35260/m.93798 type:complete len:321 (-) Transcript_35260:749-1711(-)
MKKSAAATRIQTMLGVEHGPSRRECSLEAHRIGAWGSHRGQVSTGPSHRNGRNPCERCRRCQRWQCCQCQWRQRCPWHQRCQWWQRYQRRHRRHSRRYIRRPSGSNIRRHRGHNIRRHSGRNILGNHVVTDLLLLQCLLRLLGLLLSLLCLRLCSCGLEPRLIQLSRICRGPLLCLLQLSLDRDLVLLWQGSELLLERGGPPGGGSGLRSARHCMQPRARDRAGERFLTEDAVGLKGGVSPVVEQRAGERGPDDKGLERRELFRILQLRSRSAQKLIGVGDLSALEALQHALLAGGVHDVGLRAAIRTVALHGVLPSGHI